MLFGIEMSVALRFDYYGSAIYIILVQIILTDIGHV